MSLLLAVGLAAPVAAVGEAGSSPMHPDGAFAVEIPEDARGDGRANHLLFLNAERRRAYNVVHRQPVGTRIRLFDIDSRELLAEVDIPQVVVTPFQRPEWTHALDRTNNRLFLGYQTAGSWSGLLSVDGDALEAGLPAEEVVSVFPSSEAAEPTGRIIQGDPTELVSEPGEVDDLEEDNFEICTSSICMPQVPGVRPNLMGMDYVPPELTGSNPKVLLLLQEAAAVPGLERSFSVVWIAQWDAATGTQDWIYSIRACSNAEIPRAALSNYQVGVFQARLGTGIFVGCAAGGGTGQVVHLGVEGGTNTPQTEEAYPGPLGVQDVIGDPEGDRMLFRVMPSGEGEGWWVFDGSSRSYAGVVGTTVAPARTAGGIDPASGRLYVVAPETATAQHRRSAALFAADIRRSPVPQALTFPEFGKEARGRIQVDVHPETGERRIFVLPNAEDCSPGGACRYTVIRDELPISFDPRLDEVDALTTNVEEEEGVTGADYTGTAHTYGIRQLIVGGLDGVPPGGPAITEIRPGRYAMVEIGSPCGRGEREIALGQVRRAALSNNLAAAAATAGSLDAGTTIDLEQPTARCYPFPEVTRRPIVGNLYPDPFDPDEWHNEEDPGEDPSDEPTQPRNPVDAAIGQRWAFEAAQCAGDETTVQANRPAQEAAESLGDGEEDLPIEEVTGETEELLGERIAGDGAAAVAECDQSAEQVRAHAEVHGPTTEIPEEAAPVFEVSGLDGIGTIRVGETSSEVHMYRDPVRGLVARSVAVVRNIDIGGEVFIDTAMTIAEAWANGRPGRAGTAFVRRLCGVRAPVEGLGIPMIEETFGDVRELEAETRDALREAELDLRDLVRDTTGETTPLTLAGTLPWTREIPDTEQEGGLDVCGDAGFPILSPALAGEPANLGSPPLVGVLNRIFGARARANAPEPDGELAWGTPGGYLASVQKDRLEQVSSQAIANDASTQVPALEIIVFNDDPANGRARQIIQLAGVDASVTYGIFLLDRGFEFDFDDDLDFDLPAALLALPPPRFTAPQRETPPAEDPIFGQQPIHMVFDGVGFLLRSPGDALLAAALWLMLFAPVNLALRRRALREVMAR